MNQFDSYFYKSSLVDPIAELLLVLPTTAAMLLLLEVSVHISIYW
jgi:hypothetical protein